jgi:hypothetical protein
MGDRIMDKNEFDKSGIEKELIIEELRQRYNQYRWEENTRDKFIYSYIIFYLAFFALFRFLIDHRYLLGYFPGNDPNIQYAFIFLFLAVIGTIWLVSIISFKKAQIVEGRTILDIEKLSPYLADKIGWPEVGKIWKTNSTSPLAFIIFLLNETLFLLSIYFYNPPAAPYYKNIFLYVNLLAIIGLIFYAYFMKPGKSSFITEAPAH